MKLVSKPKFYTGLIILTFLILSYFIKINIDSGSNYETTDTLLGIIIFHSPIILLVYLSIISALIISGIKKTMCHHTLKGVV